MALAHSSAMPDQAGCLAGNLNHLHNKPMLSRAEQYFRLLCIICLHRLLGTGPFFVVHVHLASPAGRDTAGCFCVEPSCAAVVPGGWGCKNTTFDQPNIIHAGEHTFGEYTFALTGNLCIPHLSCQRGLHLCPLFATPHLSSDRDINLGQASGVRCIDAVMHEPLCRLPRQCANVHLSQLCTACVHGRRSRALTGSGPNYLVCCQNFAHSVERSGQKSLLDGQFRKPCC